MKITFFCKQWKFRCHCSYAPKFALFTKGSKLPLNKGFKNMFELLQSCAQPSKCLFCVRWLTLLTLKVPITRMLSALSTACDFKSHFCKVCGPRSDCSCKSSLIRVYTVCQYAKIGLKSLQEYSADDINRRHFQMQVFLAF